MRVRVKVRMSKIMRTPIKVGLRTYATYANCRTLLGRTYFLILKRRALAQFSLTERSLTWHCQLRFASILTPKYFTLSVGYSLLTYSLTFKLSSKFFCLDLLISISVFFNIEWNFIFIRQLTSCFKSALTSFFSFFIELLKHNKLVSSAKWWTLQNFIARLASFIFNRNRRDPRTKPLGKPQFIAATPES